MSPRRKKALILVLKLAVLLAIAEYARRQAQTSDSLAVRDPGGVRLTSIEGAVVPLPVQTKLAVTARTTGPRGEPRSYLVAGPHGSAFEIGAADVQGADAHAPAEGPYRFTLLPGHRHRPG